MDIWIYRIDVMLWDYIYIYIDRWFTFKLRGIGFIIFLCFGFFPQESNSTFDACDSTAIHDGQGKKKALYNQLSIYTFYYYC